MALRWSGDALSSGAGELFRSVGIEADGDGVFDASDLRVEVDTSDLDAARLVHRESSRRVQLVELHKLPMGMPQFRPIDDSNAVVSVLFADNGWTVVTWSRGGRCAFRDVGSEHLMVLRSLADSASRSNERRDAGISIADTVLVVSALYGCRGLHRRDCPHPGDRSRSLIREDGSVDAAKLARLTAMG
jgi:hypothetical protein